MTVQPTARYMLNQVAKRRGWEVSTDTHSDNSDKFTRDGESLVVYYDTVYQSVLYAGKAYGDMAELNHKSRKKKEKVRSWLNEPRKQTEYPERPPTAPYAVPDSVADEVCERLEKQAQQPIDPYASDFHKTGFTTTKMVCAPEQPKPKTTWNVVLFGPNRFSHVTVEADDFSIDNVNGVKALIFGGLINPTHFYNMAYVVSWEKA